MSNREQLNRLRQSVRVWNDWRDNEPSEDIDLSRADFYRVDLSGGNFSNANLSEANFSGANLSVADLSETNLSGANFSGANFSGANFSGANFSGANLRGVDFNAKDLREASLDQTNLSGDCIRGSDLREANLTKANLNGADLREADLRGANLHEASLSMVDLRNANLSEADLSAADLSGVSLSKANLKKANLSNANLSDASLSEADLSEVDFSEANLSGVNFGIACLINSNFEGSTLTNACLWETQRSGWVIKDVICEALYWDKEKAKLIQYQPGEFERLFSEKTKIILHYKDGIGPLEIASLPALIQNLEASHQGCKLSLKSIEDASEGAVVTIVIDDADNDSPEELEKLRIIFQSEAEQKVANIRQAFKREKLLMKEQISTLDKVIDKFLSKPTYYLKEGNINMGDEYNNSGQAGAFGANAHAHDNTFNQIVNQLEKSINLSDLAQQLADLRQAAAAKQDTSAKAAIAVGNLAAAEEAANEKNPSKVVASLKAAGEWALDLAKDIGKEVAVEAIKQSMGMP